MSSTVDASLTNEVPGAALDHKLLQLCSQVEEAVAMGLFSSRDPNLRDLCVIDVTPLRGASRLRVRLTTEYSDGDLFEIQEVVDRARGYLRAETAHAIHRKKTPDLVFEVVPPELAFSDSE